VSLESVRVEFHSQVKVKNAQSINEKSKMVNTIKTRKDEALIPQLEGCWCF
jgi:hypothetical protein